MTTGYGLPTVMTDWSLLFLDYDMLEKRMAGQCCMQELTYADMVFESSTHAWSVR
jgi:hypothetical protein